MISVAQWFPYEINEQIQIQGSQHSESQKKILQAARRKVIRISNVTKCSLQNIKLTSTKDNWKCIRIFF
jgi:hypothetical protein